MTSCERCWERSHLVARERNIEQVEAYRQLVLTSDCTPEQQAGGRATECPKCKTMTCHQHTGQCVACGLEAKA